MDIDIDFQSEFNALDVFPQWIKASIVKDEQLLPHVCGIYPVSIPVDPVTGLSAIPYEEAEKLGYQKIDFLHLHIYNIFSNREDLRALIDVDPDWDMLLYNQHVSKLFQLSNHGDVLQVTKPRSIEDLADTMALIRPGKRGLLKLYTIKKDTVRKVLYEKEIGGGYSFKKSHAIAYSMIVVLQLHAIKAGIL